MQALFVHGMGRSPVSALPLLWRLKKQGISASSIFYTVTLQNFSSIESRLRKKIVQLSQRGDYVLIGHSLGGVLIRSALAGLSPETKRPERIFLLGSPVRPSRIAQYLRRNWLFRLATRDCGQLLSSEERMQNIAPCVVPTTCIIGTRGIYGRLSPFGDEANDGIVSESEVKTTWDAEVIRVPVLHTQMPFSRQISQLLLERISSSSPYITEK